MQRSERKPLLRVSELRDKPTTIHDKEITPIGRVLQVSWPGGTFLWQQPLAIEVRQGGVMRRLPIPNATLRATTSIIVVGLAIVVFTASWRRLKNARRRRLS